MVKLILTHWFDILGWTVAALVTYSAGALTVWLTVRATERQQQRQEEARQKSLLVGLLMELEQAVPFPDASFHPEVGMFAAPIALADLAPVLAGGIVDPVSHPELFRAVRQLSAHIILYQKYVDIANPILIDTERRADLREPVHGRVIKLHKQALNASHEVLRELKAQGFVVGLAPPPPTRLRGLLNPAAFLRRARRSG